MSELLDTIRGDKSGDVVDFDALLYRLIETDMLLDDLYDGVQKCPSAELEVHSAFARLCTLLGDVLLPSHRGVHFAQVCILLYNSWASLALRLTNPSRRRAHAWESAAGVVMSVLDELPNQEIPAAIVAALINARNQGYERGTNEWARTLVNEAAVAQATAKLGHDSALNLAESVSLCVRARNEGLTRGTVESSMAMISEVNARVALADLGRDSVSNLNQSIQLCQEARTGEVIEGTITWALSLLAEAGAVKSLAVEGVASRANLYLAHTLCKRAQDEGFAVGSSSLALSLMNEANSRQLLAREGTDEWKNLDQAIRLYERARNEGFIVYSSNWGLSLLNEASAYLLNAELGRNTVASAILAIELQNRSRQEGLVEGTTAWAMSLVTQANAQAVLASHGLKAEQNLHDALVLCERARQEGLAKLTVDWAVCLGDEACVRNELAKLGFSPHHNLQEALILASRARVEGARTNTPAWGRLSANEAVSHQLLARHGLDPRANLSQAVRSHRQARSDGLSPGSNSWAKSLMNEALCETRLAEIEEFPLERLTRAIGLFQKARTEGLLKGTSSWARSLMFEATARWTLAARRVSVFENLAMAIGLCEQSRNEGFMCGTPDWGSTLAIQATASEALARQGVESLSNLEASIELYMRSRKEGLTRDTPDWSRSLMNEANASTLMAGLKESVLDTSSWIKRSKDLLLEALAGVAEGSLDRLNLIRRIAAGSVYPMERFRLLSEAINISSQLRSVARAEENQMAEAERDAGLYADFVSAAIAVGGKVDEAIAAIHEGKSQTLATMLRRALPEAEAIDDAEERALLEALREAEDAVRAAAARASAPMGIGSESLPSGDDALRQRVTASDNLVRAFRKYEAVLSPHLPSPSSAFADAQRLGSKGFLVEIMVTAEGWVTVHHDLAQPYSPRAKNHMDEGQALRGSADVFLETLMLAEQCSSLLGLLIAGGDPSVIANALDEGHRLVPSKATLEVWGPELRAKRAEFRQGLTETLREIGSLLVPSLIEGIPEGVPIILSPHWFLNSIPLHALPIPGENQILIERNPVGTLPVPTLAEPVRKALWDKSSGSLAFGNPTGDLDGADLEARDIAKLLDSRTSPAEFKLKQGATWPELEKRMRKIGVLHLACHGEFDAFNPGASAIILADKHRLTLAQIAWQLKLPECNLVFLSACESGKASMRQTDELLGLARGFLLAGAPTIIASLWRAGDDTALTFATHFYTEWCKPGVTLINAFRHATLETRKPDPDNVYSWATFTMIGAWNTVLP